MSAARIAPTIDGPGESLAVPDPDRVRIAVIDDDPTGTQTVRDVPLVMSWDPPDLEWAMATARPLFAILTNSRALPESRAIEINREIGERLTAVADRLGVDVRAISRGDSTLRGHFPAEPEALAAGLATGGRAVDVVLLCPAYPEAGRVTIDDVHFLRTGEALVPVGETEFARDPVFGYHASDLVAWIRERAGRDAGVATIGLDELRAQGPSRVAEVLLGARGRARYVVANAVEERDLAVIAGGVALAERRGLRLVCRTGPSFLSASAGWPAPAPLEPAELGTADTHGLVVVGSHTELTTRQLRTARARHALGVVLLDVDDVLGGARDDACARAVAALRAALRDGDAALVTSRASAHERSGDALGRAAAIADAIVAVVGDVAADADLGWVLAKGGITSHDVAVRALGAQRATVRGQLFPGQVSVWELGTGSLRPGLTYVVFPGNVGDEDAFALALDRLKGVA
ncbi:MAG TPA: four-carbon acid sugar kinase family protein [Baekduia sp.]|uniref:four-carbon acid sugar kinase family protein n=1 Tax=Baekduia sp. TaxID=2600305 RepID=UPI002D770BBC|nr:four-carbon acid sugar kinase family protein [Baekduia sp.]HET6507829.1 four-carbon acid sugar kinase family protein [Baekduia sp.]